MNFACPNCRSEDIRRLSMIYKEGLASIDSVTTGAGGGIFGGGGGVGGAVAKTSGTQQSVLSTEAAPPQRRSAKGPGVWLTIGLVLVLLNFGFNFWFFVGIAVSAVAARSLKKVMDWNSNEFVALMKEWENSYLCRRCAAKFALSGGVAQVA